MQLPRISRRAFLRRSIAAGAVLTWSGWPELVAAAPLEDGFRGGVRLGELPFRLSRDLPYGQLVGEGLNARLYTDLSGLSDDRLVTPVEEFFVRTSLPTGLAPSSSWPVSIVGGVRPPAELTAETLATRASDRGALVLECAGNSRWTGFSLISVGRWSGVPLSELLAEVEPFPHATAVRVAGVDEPSGEGASECTWIFTRRQLEESDAFLATHLDGSPLPPHHGAPVRLVVPGWYGCTWIKWVRRVELVSDDQPATAQMREFAQRTHQDGVPEWAREYRPATVDLAAMPVRVERWRVDGRLRLRLVGILWGGGGSTDRLAIRFAPDQPFEPVTGQPADAGLAWSLWTHAWTPPRAGRYLIQLSVQDPAVSTRRLDVGYYARGIEVDSLG